MSTHDDTAPATKADIAVLISRFDRIDQRLQNGDTHFQSIDQQFEKIDQRFENIDTQFKKIDERFEKIDQRFEKIDQRFEKIDQRFDAMEKDIDLKLDRLHRRIIHEVRVINEDLIHDFNGAFNDRTLQHTDTLNNHEGRLKRIEKDLHIVA